MLVPHMAAATRRALRLNRPGRELAILPDDTFLVSYPKSGNTWVRMLLANCLSPSKPADFPAINRLIPDPDAQHKRLFDRMPRPRVIKSHFCFDPRYPRVIYIVRDPRDVAISEYHYQRKARRIADDHPLEHYISRFLSGKTWPENGSWAQHVASWVISRGGDPNFLLVRYEALLADTESQLARIASFLRLPTTSHELREAVKRSSADRMRSLEAVQGQQLSLIKGTRSDIAFIRSAKSGGWRSELAEPLVAEIETAWGPILRYLGYEVRSGRAVGSVDPVAVAFDNVLLCGDRPLG